MSLKENIEMVKDELNSEEKFFEKAVITERFVKKYKKPLIGAVVAIVVIVVANLGYQASEQNRIESANETLAQLQKNPADKLALAQLETLSPALHDVWVYSQAVSQKNTDELEKLKNSKALIVNDVSSYEAAELKEDVASLENYSEQQKAIYKDLATVMSAVLLMQEGKIDEAHDKLEMIGANSPLAQVASALMHYGVK
ncbi:tetratricopeptide repeat protein [Sulfurimonas paralvinellae]|uniref:Tetratricopeptide repeat-like domain-containing protein n=1 Tax=Sulfurimonas paralvinellae TaxID=317658 RepID=A0A7M1BB06_9BACT|nr:tetratricopeptide repeat protein [Sulfurimonas paralvinellae]QOP45952.1 hypothetical protein FM071_06465 [Sulfurimonas paralvinellae]